MTIPSQSLQPEQACRASKAKRIAMASGADHDLDWLQFALKGRYELVELSRGSGVIELLSTLDAIIVGDALEDMSCAELVAAIRAVSPDTAIFDAGDREQGLQLERAVHFVLTPNMDTERINTVIASALPNYYAPAVITTAPPKNQSDALQLQAVLDATRSLAAVTETDCAATLSAQAALELVDGDRAHCYFYDDESGLLWNEDHNLERAGFGLCAFAARTSTTVSAPEAQLDPLYQRMDDDHQGLGNERLLIQPIAGSGLRVHAILVVLRSANRPHFSTSDEKSLALFAHNWAPFLDQLVLRLETEAALQGTCRGPFRQEAIDAHDQVDNAGDLVRVSPAWLPWTYALVLAVLAAGVVWAVLGTVDEFAEGTAVVRMSGRVDVPARVPGTISSVHVEPGQSIKAGDTIVRLYAATERAEVDRLETQFEAQLLASLRTPGNPETEGRLASLNAQRVQAQARLDEQVIRAPRSGVVGDLRARQGQAINPGDVVVSLLNDESSLSVVAFLPGNSRPELHEGQTIRLTLQGYERSSQEMTVESVGEDVIGPQEVRRFLGNRLGDSLQIRGPVVMIRARLTSPTLESEGKSYQYFDGMQGTAEVKIGSRSMLHTLIPSLQQL